MLSNAYFLAKFRFDTAENEPAKNLQKFANFPSFADPTIAADRCLRWRPAAPHALWRQNGAAPGRLCEEGRVRLRHGEASRPCRRNRPAPVFGKISAKFRSFSAVSAPIFATKYAFCSIFQNLPDYLAEFFEICQNFAKFTTFAKFLLKFHENC